MASATDHCRTLLAAIIPDRRDLLDKAMAHLAPSHFPDQMLRTMFELLERYYHVTGTILTRAALTDLLHRARADAGKLLAYQELYDYLTGLPATEADFRWSLEQVRELAAERATGDALTGAMEILTRGSTDDRGDLLKGHAQARAHLLQRFAEIDRDLSMQEAPEGDMRVEGEEMLAEYAAGEAARTAGRHRGILSGVPPLDAKTDGFNNGELVLVVGWTSDGKTSFCVQLAWSACVEQGKNVVFLTTETLRNQVRRRLVARHSCLDRFGIPGGLNSRDIKNFTLPPELKPKMREVIRDFNDNPAYGHCYLVQVPRSADMGYIESKLARVERNFRVDLVIMDYLALLKPERRRNSDREELGNTLKGAKQLCTTFADGRGVPFISPWQVSRTARAEADRTGTYNPSALSETAEAANSADVIISLLAPLDNDSRITTAKMQVMKNRDGEKASSIEVAIDYATSRFYVDSGRRGGYTMDGLI